MVPTIEEEEIEGGGQQQQQQSGKGKQQLLQPRPGQQAATAAAATTEPLGKRTAVSADANNYSSSSRRPPATPNTTARNPTLAADRPSATSASSAAAVAASTKPATGKQLRQQRQQQQHKAPPNSPAHTSSSSSSSNYISSLVNKSSILLHSLKQQCTSLTSSVMQPSAPTSPTANTSAKQQQQQQQQQQRSPLQPATPQRHKSDHGQHHEGEAAATAAAPSCTPARPQAQHSATKRDTEQQQQQQSELLLSASGAGSDSSSRQSHEQQQQSRSSGKPPLPPPPPREVVQAAVSAGLVGQKSAAALAAGSLQNAGTQSLGSASVASPTSPVFSARRHALQEQSLEREAALSLKARELKPHKRTSSIKSALRRAHLGSLRSSKGKRAAQAAAAEKLAAAASSVGHHLHHHQHGASSELTKSMPYELFEPPVTQRTFERSKRRDAMLADPKRQLSADTIGLRQLTDEYLHNAGVKPMSSSGQYSLVALTGPAPATCRGGGGGVPLAAVVGLSTAVSAGAVAATAAAAAVSGQQQSTPGSCAGVVSAGAVAQSGGGGGGGGGVKRNLASVGYGAAAANQPASSIEQQLYQASKHALPSQQQHHHHHHHRLAGGKKGSANGGGANHSDSEDSLSSVVVLPGNLPWQSDVSIQCELLQAPPLIEPYETTGDILNTIAGPFRGGTICAALGDSGGTCSLEATLKRGLTAITGQHHLSPAGCAPGASALQVVGSLKKSLSNTLDIGLNNAKNSAAQHLRSQDSLPAYSSLRNEPELPGASGGGGELTDEQVAATAADTSGGGGSRKDSSGTEQGGGLIGHLASKITRQSSKKFAVSKKGLQRALSFDCRGYQRLSGAAATTGGQQQGPTASGAAGSGQHSEQTRSNLLSAKHRAHNRSTLGLNVDQSPRPYLPQSASQVDFQVPLLPYHKMQEAIVSQRLLEPPGGGVTAAAQESTSEGSLANADHHQNQNHGHHHRHHEQHPPPPTDVDELICGPLSQPTSGGGGGLLVVDTGGPPRSPQQTDLAAAGTSPSMTANSSDGGDDDDNNNSNKEMLPSGLSATPTTVSSGGGSIIMVAARSSVGMRKTTPPPRLMLDIPTIATPTQEDQVSGGPTGDDDDDDDDDGGEEVCAADQDEANKATVIVCLPSPNIAIDPGFNVLPNSASFYIDPHNHRLATANGCASGSSANQLTANDVFARSQSLIKRPSTLMADTDAMSQVAQALSSTGSSAAKPTSTAPTTVPVVLKNRRQAIVPPKLATDASNSDSDTNQPDQPRVGQLVDVDDDDDSDDAGASGNLADGSGDNRSSSSRRGLNRQAFGEDEEAAMRALRRKRSGGGACAEQQGGKSSWSSTRENRPAEESALAAAAASSRRRLSGSQQTLPTFFIEPNEPSSEICASPSSSHFRQQTPDIGGGRCSSGDYTRRPDSQLTNIDSLVSSGSSGNLSTTGKRGGGGGEFTVTSPGGLTVSFGSSRGRRRSSIAVIPQMQICPGDLIVYSKQLIDRMNQSDDTEPPQFLTIDADKKGKNIWSSFKLFDNRTLKARNELLCSLEDVLASLQPSTFVDEQLSHYKGMLWNEFLYETESRRSASSEVLSMANDRGDVYDDDHEHDDANNRGGPNGNNNAGNDGDDYNSASNKDAAQEPSGQVAAGSLQRQRGQQQQQQSASEATSTPQKSPLRSDSAIAAATNQSAALSSGARETIKATMSSGGGSGATSGSTAAGGASGGPHRSRDPTVRSISSRFREKPKLKRGQTVDSVFRIPLIPSSPLKHAQQHQQTPTAHLEDHDLITIEDDERGSPSASNSRTSSICRQHRSSSTRSRSGSNNQRGGGGAVGARSGSSSHHHLGAAADGNNDGAKQQASGGGGGVAGDKSSRQMPNGGAEPLTAAAAGGPKDQDSSFETDDAMDLLVGHSPSGGRSVGRTPHQIMRQSSLSTLSSTITRTEQKRQRALWDLFQSECAFFFDHLMTLKNVYMEPLKKIQVEGFAMFADPDVLFGNLDELCCGVYDFCKEFLYIIMRTLKTRPEELNATDVLIKLYKKNPKIDHLRGVYHRYTLNYINALTYLESLRRQVEFVEFEKWSSRDVRCKKLQLTDLLVAPVQHIMRVPIILKDIESHTEHARDRDEIRAILAVEEASLRELDDKMRWLKNFERLLEIQKNISWPSVLELDPKLFIPDFLKEVLSKQPCEKLIVSPRRQIVHEGTLSNLDLGKACDMHVILFDDMLLLTRRKKGLTKKASTVCKTNSGGTTSKDDGSFKYIVYKQPLSLDRFYVHDVQQVDAQSVGAKHLFLLIVMNRFQQIINVHSFSAPNDDVKQTWLFKIKRTADRWKKNFTSSMTADQPQQPDQRIQTPTPTVSQQTQAAASEIGTHLSGSGQRAHQQQQPAIVPKVVDLSAAMRGGASGGCSAAPTITTRSPERQQLGAKSSAPEPTPQVSRASSGGGPQLVPRASSRQPQNCGGHAAIELIVTSAPASSYQHDTVADHSNAAAASTTTTTTTTTATTTATTTTTASAH